MINSDINHGIQQVINKGITGSVILQRRNYYFSGMTGPYTNETCIRKIVTDSGTAFEYSYNPNYRLLKVFQEEFKDDKL